MFNLKKPCKDCPFLKNSDMRHSLMPGRLEDIISDLLSNDYKNFRCHKTIDYANQDESGELIRSPEEQLCYGSMIFLQKIGRPSVIQRFGYVTGEINFKEITEQMATVVDPEDIKPKGLIP